jgi:hypothetical protein
MRSQVIRNLRRASCLAIVGDVRAAVNITIVDLKTTVKSVKRL